MLSPGLIQIALKESARFYLPAAMIYDYPLDTEAHDYSLCPTFRDAWENHEQLEDGVCFQGECPDYGNDTVVCPSGFWGYRHALGLPLSIAGAPDVTPEIVYQNVPELAVCVWAGNDFQMRVGHEQVLQALQPGLGWQHAAQRKAVFQLLQSTSSHLVYFYCHGGVKANGTPYIQVGSETGRGRITRSNLRVRGIRWGVETGEPRPLVFINGCHTTALEPEVALDFVSAFVENAAASGVIGTEITILEPLACAFGEEFLRRLLAGTPVGEAVRGTRLALLKAGNPLDWCTFLSLWRTCGWRGSRLCSGKSISHCESMVQALRVFRNLKGLLDYGNRCRAASILSNASLNVTRGQAKLSRTNPFPPEP